MERDENNMNSEARSVTETETSSTVPMESDCSVAEWNTDNLQSVFLGQTSPNTRSCSGLTPIQWAVRSGDESTLSRLLEVGADPNAIDQHGETALHVAIQMGKLSHAKTLLKSQASINFADRSGSTSLHRAARLNRIKILRALFDSDGIDKEIDLEVQNSLGQTPLSLAAHCGHLEVMQLLLQQGAKATVRSKVDGKNAIIAAVEGGRAEVIRPLIAAGADVHARDDAGYTALHHAAEDGHHESVQVLLEHGVPVDILSTGMELTSLLLAASGVHRETIHLLLERGAEVDAKDSAGRTALHWAAEAGLEELVTIMLGHSANIDNQDKHGVSVLSDAANGGSLGALQLLLECGASVHSTDSQGNTALHHALLSGTTDAVELLLKYGIDLEAIGMGDKEYTALQLAAARGRADCICMLLKAGSDSAAMSHGKTACQIAIEKCHLNVMAAFMVTNPIDIGREMGPNAGIPELSGHADLVCDILESIEALVKSQLRPSFFYQPLPPGKWIRVIELLPGCFENPIRCKLILKDLDMDPIFEPLSYYRGDGTLPNEISCDGQLLHISANLFGALRRFRFTAKSRYLWADGVCINRKSTIEIDHQVAIMPLIYERGQRTLIWLGDEGNQDAIDQGMRLMIDLGDFMQTRLKELRRSSRSSIPKILYDVIPPSDDHPFMTDELGWSGIREIVENSYFKRLWVQQEIGLSGKADLFFGKSWIPMAKFGRLLALCSAIKHTLALKTGSTTINFISETMEVFWSPFCRSKSWMNDRETLQELMTHLSYNQNDLLPILNVSRRLEATLAVDHIYAVLGLPSLRGVNGGLLFMDIKYDRSVEETSVMLAERICCTTLGQPLGLLCYADHFLHPNVPSWVPLWHIRSPYGFTGYRKDVDASLWKDIDSGQRYFPRFSGPWQTRQMTVKALLLQRVTGHTKPLSGEISDAPGVVRQIWEFYEVESVTKNMDFDYWRSFLNTFLITHQGDGELAGDFLAFCHSYDETIGLFDRLSRHTWFQQPILEDSKPSIDRIAASITTCCRGKKVFVTDGGELGTCPGPTAPGDILTILFGCPLPVLLRPTANDSYYQFVGSVWVAEYAQGEAVRQWKAGDRYGECKEVVLI